MKGNKKDKINIFIDALTDALGRSDEQSIEEVKNDLRDEGIDVDITVKKLMNMVKETSMFAKRRQLDMAREKRHKMESEKTKFFSKFSKLTREEILSKIKEIISLSDPTVSVSYRDLESKNTEDLRSLLEDLEIAEHRDKHEKDS